MNTEQYVNKIVREIRCGSRKKKEIRKQLLADINFRLEHRELPEDIMEQMGTVKEIADSFNEGLSAGERRKYKRTKILWIAVPVLAVLILLTVYLYRLIPRSIAIEESAYFDKAGVEKEMKRTVELLDAEDYAALQADCIEEMKPFLSKEEMDKVKVRVSEDWGSRQSFGTIYMVELIQGGKHFAVGEITVFYENVSVVYRLTYDQDMRFAGVYIR